MLAYACNPSMKELEAGGPGMQGYPQLYGDFKASLSYMKPCLKPYTKQNLEAEQWMAQMLRAQHSG